MTTTSRFEQAIKKLYSAFHNDELHPECCRQCAVGNILDRTDAWKHFSDVHGSTTLNYIGLVNQNFGKRFNGYTPSELLQIEATFLKACGYIIPLDHRNKKPIDPTNKDILFIGLTAVVEFLCELDAIDNVMDMSQLFAYQIDSRTNQLAH